LLVKLLPDYNQFRYKKMT